MNFLNPMLLCDFYKISHRMQYPEKTEFVYSTWTPRASRKANINKIVAFGAQGFIKKYLIDWFNENFFNADINQIIDDYRTIITESLGDTNPNIDHILRLHKLGYLPLLIMGVPEGMLVPVRVPILTICNTHKDFYWLTNYIETLMSSELWMPTTSATIAYQYRKILKSYAKKTDSEILVYIQGHDFSMRGMGSLDTAMLSGAGHLLSFMGTDSIPAIQYLKQYYMPKDKLPVGVSVPATEHSVECSNIELIRHNQNVSQLEAEKIYFKRLITELYPEGIISIVSDSFDFWGVIDKVIPELKNEIMARDGKVVIRADSGDPVKILCGDEESLDPTIKKGLIESLWDIFGGTVSKEGYKVLDVHIGAIYGDAITIERCESICNILEQKGFASSNVVYGIGSFSYQYNTRDTFGFALKSTLCVVDGKEQAIYKDPKTDDGIKKSQRGAVIVYQNVDGTIKYKDNNDGVTFREAIVSSEENLLRPIFSNGKLLVDDSLTKIRKRLNMAEED